MAGTNSRWGKKNITSRTKKFSCVSPDLAIIAFGVNDASGNVSALQYYRNIKSIIRKIYKINRDCEILLLGSLPPNLLWSASNHTLLQEYMRILENISMNGAPHVAFIDLTRIWQLILKNKDYYDVTGNGVNHPNDYGHRIYAESIFWILNI